MKYTSIYKWNKEKLIQRILVFPIKLVFQLAWGIASSLIYSFKWLKNGSQELVYGDDNGKSLCKIIEQNEKIIESLKH